jgi:ferric iron reductase protein FhuF
MKKQVAIAKALETQRDALMEQVKERNEAIVALSEHNDALQEKYNTAVSKLKKSVEINSTLKENLKKVTETLNEVNVINARLLYTNKVLGNVSLNERQKNQIAETISKAKSVDEAKTIYEALKGTMRTVVEKRTVPQSLTEAVQRAPSPFLPRNNNPSADPIAERWKLIAGIKK